MNSVILIGRMTRDVEMRYTTGQNQVAVASFSLAIDRPVRQGQKKETDFPRVTAFGRLAENLERFCGKGSKIAVQGRIQTGSYQGKDGKTVYTTDVIANNIEFLDSKAQGSTANSYQGAGYDSQGQSQNQNYCGNNGEQIEGFTALTEDDPVPF